jgi:hypothetical protein
MRPRLRRTSFSNAIVWQMVWSRTQEKKMGGRRRWLVSLVRNPIAQRME